jgi:hypothetical protein
MTLTWCLIWSNSFCRADNSLWIAENMLPMVTNWMRIWMKSVGRYPCPSLSNNQVTCQNLLAYLHILVSALWTLHSPHSIYHSSFISSILAHVPLPYPRASLQHPHSHLSHQLTVDTTLKTLTMPTTRSLLRKASNAARNNRNNRVQDPAVQHDHVVESVPQPTQSFLFRASPNVRVTRS